MENDIISKSIKLNDLISSKSLNVFGGTPFTCVHMANSILFKSFCQIEHIDQKVFANPLKKLKHLTIFDHEDHKQVAS